MGTREGKASANVMGQGAEERPAEALDTVTAEDAAGHLASVAAQRDQLAAEKAELQDRLLRRVAEFENFRRRAEREKSEVREFSAMETIRDLLPALDDFERALSAETSGPEFAKGMELIFQRFSGELRKLGLEPIATEGQKFDPHIHHALEMSETAEAEEHTILAEMQKGYKFRGKLLRPAMVRVAVAPSSEK
jgi:molecular chaperone GrpE